MTQVPASSHGGGISIPSTTNSVPAGTRLQLDEFGDLFLIGTGGDNGYLEVSDTGSTKLCSLHSSQGAIFKNVSAQVLDSGGNYSFLVVPSGVFSTRAHAAPADADLADGECALWFDQTNGAGATKLMVKAKSADGTVKTAAVVLA